MSKIDLSHNEIALLQSAGENGIIDIDGVLREMQKKERKEILNRHNYDIFQSKDGRYRTYVPDDSKMNKRRLITKTHLTDLEDELIEHYMAQNDSEKAKKLTLADFIS